LTVCGRNVGLRLTSAEKEDTFSAQSILAKRLIMAIENQPLSNSAAPGSQDFVDRRNPNVQRNSPGMERRQFSDGHASLSADAAELGQAIDQYKLDNCRRYISYEEMLSVIHSLGYQKK
jgi:hypothetical protein